MRIGYFADGPWSHEALKKILGDSSFSIQFICARFDKPDQVLLEMASDAGIMFLVHQNINSEDFLSKISGLNCDAYVSMSFNQIFKSVIINQTPLGIINCHAGRLPFYRGRNVLNWVLINGEREFGVTVHYVDEGIDTGDIIAQETYPISDLDDYSSLLERAYLYCSDLLYRSLKLLNDGSAQRIKQNDIHPVGFYCSQRKVGDEVINWSEDSLDIFNFVRGICFPGPQARAFIDQDEVKINKVTRICDAPTYKCVNGAVVGVVSDGFLVKTGDSLVKVIDFTSHRKIKIGDRFR